MAINHSKVLKHLDNCQRILKPEYDEDKFLLAICQTQLGNYAEAQRLFEKSCKGMLKTQWWKKTSEPNLLVDICILCGRIEFYPDVERELDYYKIDYRGNSLVALYSYAVMELLSPSRNDITKWIQGLLKKPKVKDTFAMGKVFQAILDENQSAFNDGLTHLLKAHEGIAKYGSLRESAEGLLCMSAMSLAYVASKRNLKVQVENDYFSIGYLEYLLGFQNYLSQAFPESP